MKDVNKEGKEGLVREILEGGDLTEADIKEQLKRRGISFVKRYNQKYSALVLVSVVVWLLPTLAKVSGLSALEGLSQLTKIRFPVPVLVVSVALFVIALVIEVKVVSMRSRLGGLDDAHESLVIIREGPYAVIRHPGYLAEVVYFTLLPVVLSEWISFTILAIVHIAVVLVSFSYLIRVEDNFNVAKWGDEYRRYMDELPAINFLNWLWNYFKK
ncbi:MAG: isoprenylcysteine carboxylmethyltransferase family protein [Theionarchaea archaeon]|nr:isoprenylcysteine carboxylmethyltransferase family protein [Theionarchaea archaeon]